MSAEKKIGQKITEARKKLHISQAQLAEKLFISSQAVGKWERGESMPDITTFSRLAEILGVDLNHFSDSFPSEATGINVKEEPAESSQETGSAKKLNWNMSGGNWVDADFSGLKNLYEKFGSSNMQNCKFIGSELSGLLLKSNNVQGCDFSRSDIRKSKFQHSNLNANNYSGCLLNDAEFLSSNISECNFTSADLSGTSFKNGVFGKNNLTHAILKNTSFVAMAIDEIVFEGKIENGYFENCAFYRVIFQHAILTNTFFKNNKNLKKVKFINCKADPITFSFLKAGKANLEGLSITPFGREKVDQ